jgi:hypothetical protein
MNDITHETFLTEQLRYVEYSRGLPSSIKSLTFCKQVRHLTLKRLPSF